MAKYEDWGDISELPNGSVLWAYELQETREHNKAVLNQKPIKGRLCFVPGDAHNNFSPLCRAQYFVPFKKGSESEYAWSKAVNKHSRCYADTEEEARAGYDGLVEKAIAWHQKRITELKECEINVPEQPRDGIPDREQEW